MGIAEAIPGVSGGTIAFITGIYQELLNTIKLFTPANFKLLFTSPRGFFKAINGAFLFLLLCGMFAGLVMGILLISKLLLSHREVLWAFFMGVVMMSIIYFGRRQSWNVQSIAFCLLFAIGTYYITQLRPGTGSTEIWYVFIAGAVAVSALILPGLSGSFMLLLFGLYDTVILTLKEIISTRSIDSSSMVLVILGIGIIVGLFSFARVLSYFFNRHNQLTMAAMIGVLIGSLSKLWPWKKVTEVLNKTTLAYESVDIVYLTDPHNYKVITEHNLMPNAYAQYADARIIMVIAAMILGLVAVYVMSRFDKTIKATP